MLDKELNYLIPFCLLFDLTYELLPNKVCFYWALNENIVTLGWCHCTSTGILIWFSLGGAENGIEFKQELQKMDQRLHKNEVYIEGLQKLEDKVQKAWKETTELQRIVRVLSREGDVEAELYARKLALEYT
mmetsp:Transcript_48795/g.93326  ORF Transcript_48795/g.93326 Transcript_48795/m.93326 type:complete len:131 (-) Transcript_48795:260-652(-)